MEQALSRGVPLFRTGPPITARGPSQRSVGVYLLPLLAEYSCPILVEGVEYGRGTDRTVSGAKEKAAFGAWRELYNEMYGMYPPQPFAS